MGVPIKLRVASSEEPIRLSALGGNMIIDAFSPKVAFERVEGGTRLDITDIYGTKSVVIPDGTIGEDGVGIKSVSVTQNGELVVVLTDDTTFVSAPIRPYTFDEVPTTGSNNPVKSNGIKLLIDAIASTIPRRVSDLTDDSGHYTKPDGGIPASDLASGVIPDITGKQDLLLFDATPTLQSANPVTSNGIKRAIDIVYNQLSGETDIKLLAKADRVSECTEGNFAALDENGNLVDSGSKASDFLTQHQSISGKADKVTNATTGHFAALDVSGNLVDSGKGPADIVDGSSTIVNSASGAVAAFEDGAEKPVESLVVGIEPVQEGSGDPAPDNVRPISGWTGVKVTRTGKNLLPTQTIEKSGTLYHVGSSSDWFFFKAGTYTVSNDGTAAYMYWRKKGTTDNNIIHTNKSTSGTFTLTEDCEIRLWFYATNTDATFTNLQFELGSTATAYEPYQGTFYSVTFPAEAGTVYGGTLDVTNGTLTVDRAIVDLGTRPWNSTLISTSAGNRFFAQAGDAIKPPEDTSQMMGLICTEYAEKLPNQYNQAVNGITVYTNKTIQVYDATRASMTSAEFKAAMSGVYLVYPLATPITYTLTPQEVTTLIGSNRIWADCGDTVVDYCADTKMYVDGAIADSGYYTKPATGIPASDIASGVIPTVHNVPSGGTTGQVLAKSSNTNYALQWVTPNPVQTVSGTDPVITGVAGTRYVCGTVDTLTLTPPSSGIVDVVFTSGTTPTVLTVTPPSGKTMLWPGWFDPESLDASTIYEINIMDGVYGAVMAWT